MICITCKHVNLSKSHIAAEFRDHVAIFPKGSLALTD